MTETRNIYRRVGPGERQHDDGQACWCKPFVLDVIDGSGRDGVFSSTIVQHSGSVQPSVAASLKGIGELFPPVLIRSTRGVAD